MKSTINFGGSSKKYTDSGPMTRESCMNREYV